MAPASSRNARVDARSVKDEAGTPADGTPAAYRNDRDFGTSRRQLSVEATPFPDHAEGAGADMLPDAGEMVLPAVANALEPVPPESNHASHRHARACRGHPRLSCSTSAKEGVDDRDIRAFTPVFAGYARP
jgi:hypothetical protein